MLRVRGAGCGALYNNNNNNDNNNNYTCAWTPNIFEIHAQASYNLGSGTWA